MAKISAVLVLIFCFLSFSSVSAEPAKTYSFSIADSNVVMKRDGRQFPFQLYAYQDGFVLTFSLPGTELAANPPHKIEVEYQGVKLSIWSTARIEKTGTVSETKFFLTVSDLLQEYEKQAYAGIVPGKYSREDILSFLSETKVFKIIVN
jgi:hypothetical protein